MHRFKAKRPALGEKCQENRLFDSPIAPTAAGLLRRPTRLAGASVGDFSRWPRRRAGDANRWGQMTYGVESTLLNHWGVCP